MSLSLITVTSWTPYPVSLIEGIVKAVIRAALPADRGVMWKAYLATLADEAEASADRMPWEPPESVTVLPDSSARAVLAAVIMAVPGSGERKRLAKVAEREAQALEDRMRADPGSGAPGPGLHCAACGKLLPPSKKHRKTCNDNCRAKLVRIRRAAAAAAARQP